MRKTKLLTKTEPISIEELKASQFRPAVLELVEALIKKGVIVSRDQWADLKYKIRKSASGQHYYLLAYSVDLDSSRFQNLTCSKVYSSRGVKQSEYAITDNGFIRVTNPRGYAAAREKPEAVTIVQETNGVVVQQGDTRVFVPSGMLPALKKWLA